MYFFRWVITLLLRVFFLRVDGSIRCDGFFFFFQTIEINTPTANETIRRFYSCNKPISGLPSSVFGIACSIATFCRTCLNYWIAVKPFRNLTKNSDGLPKHAPPWKIRSCCTLKETIIVKDHRLYCRRRSYSNPRALRFNLLSDVRVIIYICIAILRLVKRRR